MKAQDEPGYSLARKRRAHFPKTIFETSHTLMRSSPIAFRSALSRLRSQSSTAPTPDLRGWFFSHRVSKSNMYHNRYIVNHALNWSSGRRETWPEGEGLAFLFGFGPGRTGLAADIFRCSSSRCCITAWGTERTRSTSDMNLSNSSDLGICFYCNPLQARITPLRDEPS